MKISLLSLFLLASLSACQTTGQLKTGEVFGTDIGRILVEEAGQNASSSNIEKMNSEIDKALYFSRDGLTTQWYAGFNARLRPISNVRDREDRECRRFRHSQMIENGWYNGTAVACREFNVPWYLISNRWDRTPRNTRREDPYHSTGAPGQWENLAGELEGNPADQSFDDFGPRNTQKW